MKSTILCTSFFGAFLLLATNVAYSLPSTTDFNITLNEPDSDPIDPEYQVKTVILDAGHGGKDPGCLGKKTSEKEVALDVVLKVGQMIKNSYPDVNVIYTRDTDEFIPLHERAAIANRNQADLFISVHCNGVSKRSVSGSETFVLGLHRAADNLEVAKRENAAILKEENYQENYDGFDPNSDEGHIALSMYQSAYLDQSIALATLIEGEFVDHAGRTSRGVKQAGFLVLRNTYMPSVLVETGFLTNAKEENFLVTENGKLRTATSIFNAFSKYKYDIESYALQQPTRPTTPNVTEAKVMPAKAESAILSSDQVVSSEKPQTPKTMQTTSSEPASHIDDDAKTEEQPPARTSMVASTTTKPSAYSHQSPTSSSNTGTKVKAHGPSTTSAATNRYQSQQNQPSRTTSTTETTVRPTEEIEYVVQIAAGAHKLKPSGAKWQKLENVLIRYENGMYKYQVGGLQDFESASQKKIYLKQLGFSDCFIAAYKDGKPVRLTEVASTGSRQ